jgi:tetratricopeptide (TPR) repeat protein
LALDFYEVVAPRDFLSASAGADEAMHLAEAADRWRAGDREGSVRLLNNYLQSTPDDFDARQFHAILCAQLAQFDKMAEDSDAMVALRGNQSSVYIWRGIARLLVDRVDAGLEDINTAASMDAQSIWVKVLKGFAFVLSNRPLDALTYFDDALRGSPGSVVARMGRAFAQRSLARFGDAVADASEVIRVEPSNADALIVRGDCYADLSDFAAAAKDYERAMAVAGRTPALALRYLNALVGQRSGDAKSGESKLAPDGQPKEGAADPDGDASQGPLFDWINRKIRPRSTGRDR